MKIALTCGYDLSVHTLALLDRLRKAGFEVDTVLLAKTFSLRRFNSYRKRLGFNALAKKIRDRFAIALFPQVEVSAEAARIKSLLPTDIGTSSVSAYCREHTIKCISAESFSASPVLEAVKGLDLLIYAGGGILRRPLIESFSKGVLNCHAGKLPEIKGMNAAEWSVLLEQPQGNTVHFIDVGVDTGDIIEFLPHSYEDCSTIDDIRGEAVRYAIEDLLVTVERIQKGEVSRQAQDPNQGRQYYVMHESMKRLAEQKWRARRVA